MSCCGRKRESLSGSYAFNQGQAVERKSSLLDDIVFVYTGATALTVKGNITGITYRFHRPNERQLIDGRDASSMMAIPVLRRVW